MAEDLQQYTKAQLIEMLQNQEGCGGTCSTAKELSEQLEQEKQTRQEYEQMVDDLEKKLESTGNVLRDRATIVEHEGESYEIVAKSFKHKGQLYHAEDLKDNKELFAELLKKGIGFIQKL